MFPIVLKIASQRNVQCQYRGVSRQRPTLGLLSRRSQQANGL